MTGKEKLFILAEPRSGSSWLLKTLNSHKKIKLLGELYNHAVFKEVLDFHQAKKKKFHMCINYLENKIVLPGIEPFPSQNIQYTGCKILFTQLEVISLDFAAYFIENYKDAYFLFLTRQNIVESNLSLKIARTYKIWHVNEDKDIIKRIVHIDPEEFFLRLESTRKTRNKYLRLLENLDVKNLQLTYEELFEAKNKKIEEICEFLNISPAYITNSNEKKGNPFRLNEVAGNYEEVKNYLKKYPFYYEMLPRE
jgi:LPS sulfotransferase NodH